MKLDLFLLPRAEADIDEHCAYIARTNVEKALAFDRAVFESFDRLCEMPLIGSERSYINPELFGLRMWFVKGFENYLIYYIDCSAITLKSSGYYTRLKIETSYYRKSSA